MNQDYISIKDLEEQNIFGSFIEDYNILNELKASASQLKLSEISINGEHYWGIALSIQKKEFLLGINILSGTKGNGLEEFTDYTGSELESDCIFKNSSKEFVENCIQELFVYGFLNLLISPKGFIFIEPPEDTNITSYGLYGLFLEISKITLNDRKLFWGTRFFLDQFFFQDMGPYEKNENLNAYKEVVDWCDEALNGEELKSFHYSVYQEHYHDLSSMSHDSLKAKGLFINAYKKDEKEGALIKKLERVISSLRDEKFTALIELIGKYSLIASLYCLVKNKSPAFFSSAVTAISRQTIDNAIQDITYLDPESDSGLEASSQEIQVRAIKESVEDYQATMNFLNLFIKQEIDIKDLLKQDESKYLEFKSTLKYSLDKKEDDNHLAWKAMQSICAFSSAREGGILIIGIQKSKRQDYEVIGIEKDGFKKSGGLADTDLWELKFWERFESYTDCKVRNCLEINYEVLIDQKGQKKTIAIIELAKEADIFGIFPWYKGDKKGQKGKIKSGGIAVLYGRVGPQNKELTYSEIRRLDRK